MGNFGGGGHNRTHGRYESSYKVDSFQLNNIALRGVIPYSWTKNGKPPGAIGIIHDMEQEQYIFYYTWNGSEAIKNRVNYKLVKNNYGGSRMYFC